MKFGVCEQLLHSRLGPMVLAEAGYRIAAMSGADSYWLPDHLNSVLPQSVMKQEHCGAARLIPNVDAWLEPWTALGHVAGRHRFNRMRLGTCVTDAGRRNPAVTAQAAATLHLMTRGRAILGIGTGERMGNEPYGVEWSKPVARFEEALATIRALWDSGGELVNRDSPFFPLRNASFALPRAKGTWPEIWIASHGPRMLRATGRYADAWFPGSSVTAQRYTEGLEQVQAAADNANRDPQAVTAANLHFVVTGRTSGEVEDALNSVLVRVFALNAPGWVWSLHGFSHPFGDDFQGFQDLLPQTLDARTALAHAEAAPMPVVTQLVVSGTPAEVIDKIADYRDHGERYPVLANVSTVQTKLSRGLSAAAPFMKILRALRRM